MKKLGLAIIGTLLSTSALADAVICNDSKKFDHIEYSFGSYVKTGNDLSLATSGWYSLAPNTCKTLLRGDLRDTENNRLFLKMYGYVNGAPSEIWTGAERASLCVGKARNFKIIKADSSFHCDSQNGQLNEFERIDYSASEKHEVMRIVD